MVWSVKLLPCKQQDLSSISRTRGENKVQWIKCVATAPGSINRQMLRARYPVSLPSTESSRQAKDLFKKQTRWHLRNLWLHALKHTCNLTHTNMCTCIYKHMYICVYVCIFQLSNKTGTSGLHLINIYWKGGGSGSKDAYHQDWGSELDPQEPCSTRRDLQGTTLQVFWPPHAHACKTHMCNNTHTHTE